MRLLRLLLCVLLMSTLALAQGQGTGGGPSGGSGGGGTTTNAVTFNNGGSGAASGATFDGSVAQTVSTNTIGALPANGATSTGSGASNVVTFPGSITAGTTVSAAIGYQINSAAAAAGHFLRGNGTNYVDSTIQAADVPTLNQSTTGNAATATALASAPSKCSSTQASTGVDVNGNAQGCFTPGGGNVTGPSSAASGNFPVLDSTGKVLSDSGKSASSFDPAGAASTVNTALTAEATARAAADTTNSTAITTEASTARSAEATNATAISTEATRATTAEGLKAPIASPAFTGNGSITGSFAVGTTVSAPQVTVSGTPSAGTDAINITYAAAHYDAAGAAAAVTTTTIGAVPTATTVNGHALSSNVTVTVPDLLTTVVHSSGSPYTMTGATGFYWNNTSSTYNWVLDAPIAGKQYCFGNYSTRTGALTITSTTSVYIVYKGANGTVTSGTLVSGGAAGDFICLIGVDSTHYMAAGAGYGTWTNN